MKAWKELEKRTAEKLGGKRILRGADFSKSDDDVRLEDFPHWRIDCKSRERNLLHHSLLDKVRKKYCKRPDDIAMLVTKRKRKHGEVVCMSLDDFATLVAALRVGQKLVQRTVVVPVTG